MNTVHELRAIKKLTSGHNDVLVGNYDAPAIFAEHARRLNDEAYDIYSPVNPIKAHTICDLNEPPKRRASTTKKTDIDRRTVLFYDYDVERAKGQAASDAELTAALPVVQKRADAWRNLGATPWVTHTGNGFQMGVQIDLPNDSESETLVKKVLETHKAEDDVPGIVHLDCWKDANRIRRVPGYKNWKGADTAERPRRVARLLTEASGVASRAVLENIAKAWVRRKTSSPSSAPGGAAGKGDQDALAIFKEAYMRTGRVWPALKAARKRGLKLNGDHNTVCEFANFLNNSWQEGEPTDGLTRVLETIWDECGTSADGGRTPTEVEDIVSHAFGSERKSWTIRSEDAGPVDPPYILNPKPIGLRAFRTEVDRTEWVAKNMDVLDIKPKAPEPLKIESAEWFFPADRLINCLLPEQRIFVYTKDGTPLLRSSFLMELFAFRGVGKSAVAMGLAKLLMKGGEFLDYRSEGGAKVLYVDGELPLILLQDRIKTFIGDTENLWWMSAEQLPGQVFPALIDPKVQATFEERLELLKPDVIILDTLTAVGKFDTNDADAWRVFNSFLLRLRFKGYCVIVVHHAGKNGTQRGRTDAEDNIDLVVQLTPPDGHDPGDGLKACVSYTKVRYGGRLQNFACEYVGGVWRMLVDSEEKEIIEQLNNGGSLRSISGLFGVTVSRVRTIRKKAKAKGLLCEPAKKSKPAKTAEELEQEESIRGAF